MLTEPWTPTVDWSCPAGEILRRLIDVLPKDRSFRIVVFGSAPLQMVVDHSLLSADVDLFCVETDIAGYVEAAGLSARQSEFCVQVGSELNFRAGPLWSIRARSIVLDQCTIVLPHPIDILIGKLHRLEAKDIEAFLSVQRHTAHPTEPELIEELQAAVDLFRPGFDEETDLDLAGNCRRLWPILYGKEIDPKAQIILPALERRRAGYGPPASDHKQELRDALRELK